VPQIAVDLWKLLTCAARLHMVHGDRIQVGEDAALAAILEVVELRQRLEEHVLVAAYLLANVSQTPSPIRRAY